jgi:hypothetical protein
MAAVVVVVAVVVEAARHCPQHPLLRLLLAFSFRQQVRTKKYYSCQNTEAGRCHSDVPQRLLDMKCCS